MFDSNSVQFGKEDTMRILQKFILVALAVFLVGCGGIDPGLRIDVCERANPWTDLELYNDPDNFQFAIVADRTGGARPGVFASAVEKLNFLKPEFVMCVGDLIEGYSQETSELDREWGEIDGLVNRLEMPFFYLPGNHDISNEVMAEKWRRRYGRSYYHFTYRDVLFVCLNTEDPPGDSISDKQFEYFQSVLRANRNVRWTLVFMHKPMWLGESGNWQKFEALLAERPYTVFAGHKHTYSKSVRKNRLYYTLATTGGAGGDNEENACQFDHIVWVTMTEAGPAAANLLLDGVLDDEPCQQ
jgi:hypothetical protein